MIFVTRTIPALISLLLFCTVVNTVPSRANGFTDGAEKFVKSLASNAISSLTSKNLTAKERRINFRALLSDYFDIQGIGKWALGRYWRKASTSERSEYLVLFEDLIVGTYANRFKTYSNEKLLVKGSSSRGKFAIVKSHLSTNNQNPIRVEWRVTQPDGKYKIFDIVVEGVSMIRTQRSEFSSVIRRKDGKVSGLITVLRAKLKKGGEY
jgi:phospholipid transport system substrate-binding protein